MDKASDAMAVICGEERLTYGVLNARVNQLAHYLKGMGVGPEMCVGICVERSVEMVIGFLGILKAGGVYVPLDPRHPLERLAYMLQDAGVSVLLTQKRLEERLPGSGGIVVYLDQEDPLMAGESRENLVAEVNGGNLAYVIYTSGSTGRPKGVEITHAGLTNVCQEKIQRFGLEPGSRVLQFASLNFDASIFEMGMALSSGGTLHIADVEPGMKLLDYLSQNRITHMTLTPSTLAVLPWKELPDLGVLCVAGEACSTELIKKWAAGRRFYNLYGPTETTIWATATPPLEPDSTAHIGGPIANTQVYITGGEMELLPKGMVGELCIGGDGLARGYLNRPELTAEKFVPNPFNADRPGERLYKTGDLCRYLEDGNIEYLGRRDHQVKIRGFRIELGEIEAQLREHPDVREAVVLAREDEPGQKRLVGYVVLKEAGPTSAELRNHAKERLPEYMVPSAIVLLDRLPLTANGKVDRKRLPVPESDGGDTKQCVAPRNGVEELLAGIFQRVLKVKRVGIHDNFFELGGHSLLVTQFISRAQEVLGVDLPLRGLFEAPTVEAMAEMVEAARLAGRGVAAPPIVRTKREGALPLSYAQERLWFIDQLEPNSAAYNMPGALRIEGRLDVGALERAINEIIRRHESLRTVFQMSQEGPVQVISDYEGQALPMVDLGGLPAGVREQVGRELTGEEGRRPFDLSRGPLARVRLLRLGPAEQVLLYTLHHIMSDGWSAEVVNRELGTFYEAFAEGRSSPLPELPIQYADFAVWQRGWLRGEVLEKQVSYWKEQLAGVSPLELATDHPRPVIQSFNGAAQEIKIDAATVEALKRLGAEQGVTLFMTLLAGFQVLLSRYSGQEDIVVGSPIANRTREEVEGLIGFFVNTLVLRTDLSGDPTVSELLQRVRQASLGAFEHQDLPFEILVKELQPERDLSRNPVFQVLFALNNTPQQEAQFTHLTFRPAGGAEVTTRFDLELHVWERSGEIAGVLIYNTDLFDSRTMRRMSEHFVRLVGLFVERPQNRLSELEILSASEREQLLVGWNDTAVACPKDKCVHQLFEEQVERTPEAVAVVFDGEQLSYRELNGRANQLAHYLKTKGVGPEVRVGICVERSLEMVVGLLGILKAGGAYVPLDPNYPVARLSYIIRDAQISVMLTQAEFAALVSEYQGSIVCLEWEMETIKEYPEKNLASGGVAENLAYVIYTSGSTGEPKGVAIAHRSAGILIEWGRNAFSNEELAAVLASTSICFDLSIFELFVPLSAGGRVILVENALLWVKAGKVEEVTLLNTVPSVMTELLRVGALPETLKTINLAGETLSAELVKLVYEQTTVERIHDLYGPSEDTTYSTCALRHKDRRATIGRPIANTEIYILDGRTEPVPVGVAGELHIGGDGLARGYMGRGDLTAEKFVPNPFSNQAGERLYKTGDSCRYLSDGNIEFLGRKDHQVKIRGFRIELGEIEARLREHPDVREAVVLAREDEPGQKRLVGYVELKEGASARSAELRSYLKKRLPEYMVPGFFVTLEKLPLTPNGKVDRKALPVPKVSGGEGQYVAPRSELEKLMAGTWCETLQLEQVGISDNFFDLGGHSLLAIKVITRIRKIFQLEVPLKALFENPTVAGFCKHVKRHGAEIGQLLSPEIQRANRAAPLPLSYAQERLWFIDQLEPNSAAYNMPGALRIEGRLDVGALERAINEIIRRHESLRTVFQMSQEGPVQVISDYEGQALPMVDLGGLPAGVREQVGRELTGEEGRRPFDLSRGPLARVRLLRLGPAEQVLLYTLHHIMSDGWSAEVVNRELGTFYEAFAEGRSSPLPELPIQYADFAVWQRGWLRGEVLEKQVSYWKEQLAGVSPLELATDHPRPAMQSFNGAAQEIKIDAATVEALKRLGAEQGVTLFMTLLAGFQVLLSRYSGQEDIVVGSPIANRTREEVEGLIGFFVNTLVLRTDLSGDPTVSELLQRVRQASLGAFEHQDLPFEILVKELQPERDLSRNPVFQVLFALNNTPQQEAQFTHLTFRPAGGAEVTTRFDLELHVWERSGEIAGVLIYNTDLFDSRTMRRMSEHFVRLVGLFVERPQNRLSELEILSASERERLLVGWNDTAAAYPKDKCIHELFEKQVEQTPEAVAVVFEGEQLSYRELNGRANQLAHYLKRKGVGPEVRVGICVERSLEMVVGLLGILKAGGAYVPLDANYPAERLKYMVEDSQVEVLVTQADLINRVPDVDGEKVCFDQDEEKIRCESKTNPAHEMRAENLAYVIYTSGSTGQPKGALVTHDNVVRLFLATETEFGFRPEDVWTFFHSHAFDFSVWEIWGSLIYGGRLVVVPYLVSRSPEEFYALLEKEQVTVLNQTPSAFRQLMQVEETRAGNLSLRLVIFGGEALEIGSLEPWFERHGDQRPQLVNMYGITETTVHVTCRRIGISDLESGSMIGVAIPDLQTYVLDRHGQLVPVGVVGEMYVGGDGLVRGYMGRGDLTAERFVPNPFSRQVGERLYKTGDLCRQLADGQMEYLGRADQQVKIRGFRIEPGEIETRLREHPSVRESVVMMRKDEPGQKRLVGYVVLKEAGATIAELRSHLQERAPEYMVPSAFVMLESLPLTANGKVDRKSLPVPEGGSGDAKRYERPRNGVEEILTGIFERVLKVDRAGVYDNFFELGGHSLMATQLVSRVRELFKVEMPLRDLFERPTVAGLAQKLEEEQRSGKVLTVPPLRRVDREGDIPLSYAQERLWFIGQLQPGNTGYNMPGVHRVVGELEVKALERAINEIVRRHEALRTSFQMAEGGPEQVIHEYEWQALPVVDLGGLPELDRELTAKGLIGEESGRPFDLEKGPVFRVRLLRLGAREQVIWYTLHHIVSDGWSMGVMNREIGTLYEAYARGQASPLAELAVQYGDFAVWQRRWLEGGELAKQLGYWKEQLAELSPLQLPTDYARPVMQTFNGGAQGIRLSAELTEGLRKLSQEQGATLFMTLLAGFEVLLNRYSGQEDIAVGSPIANRRQHELEGLIGFFVNTLVMRVDVSGDPTVEELLARVREVSLEAYNNQDVPFERIVEELQPGRDMSRNPLVQVIFALQNAPDEGVELKDIQLRPIGGVQVTTRFDLEVHLWEWRGITGQMIYNSDIFEHETMGRMVAQLERVLTEMVAQPGGRISELELLSEDEREQMVVGWNATASEYPKQSIQELFEEQAARRPRSIAVTHEGRQLTYEELNERANQLAYYLRRKGVRLEEKVGLCADRSLEMVVGLLGILKAGGAYVPLDGSYPRERLNYMLRDTQVRVVLSQQSLRASLEGMDVEVICLDDAAGGSEEESKTNPVCRTSAENLAYVMYTSGSTGQPKGISVVHRGVVRLVRNTNYVQLGSEERVLQLAPISFDASTFEIWGALLNGGRLVVMAAGPFAPEELGAVIEQHGVTTLWLTASLFHQMVDVNLDGLRGVKQLLAGGEVLSPAHCRKYLAAAAEGNRLINGYGPTEGTTFACCHGLGSVEEVGDSVLIGRPIANTRVYLLDERMNAVPVGVVGEIYIGGDGLAREYVNRPDLTAERFVPDAFSKSGGERLYRTGDLVRYRADGNIEFIGRKDQQVKVRGFRIELGEIESVLEEHESVEQAVVVREDGGEKRLVGYVVVSASDGAAGGQAEQVHEWERIFDEHLYGRAESAVDPMFNIVGWESTYTGEPIAAEEMKEWLEDTVRTVKECGKGGPMLEIGCGTGMLVYRLAGGSCQYWATDFSARALEYVGRHLEGVGLEAGRVKLERRAADEWEGLAGFEGVVLNSVVQYFPGMEYLGVVLEKAVRAVGEKGYVFVGDVRSFPLVEAYHWSVQLHKAGESDGIQEVKQRVMEGIKHEEELLVSPEFFEALAQRLLRITHVEIRPKRGRAVNELTQFRYSVILHVGETPELVKVARWEQWGEEGLERMRELLKREQPAMIGFKGVSNKRVSTAVRAMKGREGVENVGQLKRELESGEAGVEPEELYELGAELGYEVEVSWKGPGKEGCYDVAFLKAGGNGTKRRVIFGEPVQRAGEYGEYGNDPLAGKRMRQVVPRLRSYVQERLPEYMVPSALVVLEKLPLTVNGKIDRKALPALERNRAGVAGEFVRARDEVEVRMAGVWSEILGVERIGVHDNFFELGGHSLLATRLVSRVREVFKVELPLRNVFEAPTVAGFCKHVERHGAEIGKLLIPEIQRANRAAPLPLSYQQEEFWFLCYLLPDSVNFDMLHSMPLTGALEVTALERAFNEVIRRHEVLRTTFRNSSAGPVQSIHEHTNRDLPLVDLHELAKDLREEELRRLQRDYEQQPVDLVRQGPMLFPVLIRSAADKHLLLFKIHHIASDYFSDETLTREFRSLYDAYSKGEELALPDLPIQYADYAVWQRSWLQGEVLERYVDYWRKQLAGIKMSHLPIDYPRRHEPTSGGAAQHIQINSVLVEQVKKLDGQRVTAFMALVAGMKVLLHRYAGEEDIAITAVISGRSKVETEGLVGLFANLLLLRTNLRGDPTVVELFLQVKESILEASVYQDMPFYVAAEAEIEAAAKVLLKNSGDHGGMLSRIVKILPLRWLRFVPALLKVLPRPILKSLTIAFLKNMMQGSPEKGLLESILANRTRDEIKFMIGLGAFLFKTRPDLLRDFLTDPALKNISHWVLEIISAYGIDRVLGKVNISPKSDNRAPVGITFFPVPDQDNEPQQGITEYETETVPFFQDLILLVAENNKGLSITASYNRNVFKSETIRRFLMDLEHVLETFRQNPQRRLSELKSMKSRTVK